MRSQSGHLDKKEKRKEDWIQSITADICHEDLHGIKNRSSYIYIFKNLFHRDVLGWTMILFMFSKWTFWWLTMTWWCFPNKHIEDWHDICRRFSNEHIEGWQRLLLVYSKWTYWRLTTIAGVFQIDILKVNHNCWCFPNGHTEG